MKQEVKKQCEMCVRMWELKQVRTDWLTESICTLSVSPDLSQGHQKKTPHAPHSTFTVTSVTCTAPVHWQRTTLFVIHFNWTPNLFLWFQLSVVMVKILEPLQRWSVPRHQLRWASLSLCCRGQLSCVILQSLISVCLYSEIRYIFLVHHICHDSPIFLRSGEFVLRQLPTQVQLGWGAEGVGGRAGGHQPGPERPQEERGGHHCSSRRRCRGRWGEAWEDVRDVTDTCTVLPAAGH